MVASSHHLKRNKVTPESIAAGIAVMAQAGDMHHPEWLRAVLAGRIELVLITGRTLILPKQRLRKATRPVILSIGDDDYASTGPDGWRCARDAIAWAAAAIVHGTGGDPETYAGLVGTAERWRRLLIVETDSAHAPAWAAQLGNLPAAILVPPRGQHPVMPPRETMQ